MFMRMGLPEVIVSDNGGEFHNELDNQLCSLLNINRRLTTPYHPQVEYFVYVDLYINIIANVYVCLSLFIHNNYHRQMVLMKGGTRPYRTCWLSLLTIILLHGAPIWIHACLKSS